MNLLVSVLKLSLLGLYLAAALSFGLESLQDYRFILSVITLILFAAHVSEYVLMKSRIAALNDPDGHHFINTLLFGFLHWLPLLAAQNRKSPAE